MKNLTHFYLTSDSFKEKWKTWIGLRKLIKNIPMINTKLITKIYIAITTNVHHKSTFQAYCIYSKRNIATRYGVELVIPLYHLRTIKDTTITYDLIA